MRSNSTASCGNGFTRTFGHMPSGVHDYFSVSEFSRRVIEPFLPARHRMYPIGNPVDAVREAPSSTSNANDTFAFIGRLSAEKGCAQLAQAATRNAGVKLTFIGDGPDREAVERANPDAEITGWLDPTAGVASETAWRALYRRTVSLV